MYHLLPAFTLTEVLAPSLYRFWGSASDGTAPIGAIPDGGCLEALHKTGKRRISSRCFKTPEEADSTLLPLPGSNAAPVLLRRVGGLKTC